MGSPRVRPVAAANDPKLHTVVSFDHLVGAGEDCPRYGEAEPFGGREVYHELVLGRRLHRQIGWLHTLQDAIDI